MVFIVVAVGVGGIGLLVPASLGAVAALVLVGAAGMLVHRPLAAIPENTLTFGVGVLLSGFGAFRVGEAKASTAIGAANGIDRPSRSSGGSKPPVLSWA